MYDMITHLYLNKCKAANENGYISTLMQLFNLGDRDTDTDCISTSLDVWQFLMSDTFNHALNEHFWIALLKEQQWS